MWNRVKYRIVDDPSKVAPFGHFYTVQRKLGWFKPWDIVGTYYTRDMAEQKLRQYV